MQPAKTAIKAALSLSALFTTVAIAAAQEAQPTAPPFNDVPEGTSTYVAINYLRENGLIEGYDDGTFRPDQEINRAEALKLLLNAIEGIEENDQNNSLDFADVSPNAWYYEDVLYAWNNSLVSGYPDGLFHPDRKINVAEALKIALQHEGNENYPDVTESPYSDVPADAWFAPYAAVAKDRTIFLESRSDGSLGPEDTMTRSDFARLIYRMIKSKEGARFARTTWYGREGVNWGTASGEKFDVNLFTTAHKDLPFGTMLRVTNLANGKTVDVKVNDRGPYGRGVDLDLTQSAFAEIASPSTGVITTQFTILDPDDTPNQQDPPTQTASEPDTPEQDPVLGELPPKQDYGF